MTGVFLLFFPQSGIFMCIYRFYLIGVGRTSREEFRKYQSCNSDDCIEDHYPFGINVREFFCRRPLPSAFRECWTWTRKHGTFTKTFNHFYFTGGSRNRVLDIENLLSEIPTPWIMEQEVTRGRRTGRRLPSSLLARDSRDLIRVLKYKLIIYLNV